MPPILLSTALKCAMLWCVTPVFIPALVGFYVCRFGLIQQVKVYRLVGTRRGVFLLHKINLPWYAISKSNLVILRLNHSNICS